MKKSFIFLLTAIILLSCQSIKKLACNIESVASPKGTDVFQPNWDNIAENYKFPDWFVDGKFGIFIHWGPYSVPAFNNEWYARHMYLKDHKVYSTTLKHGALKKSSAIKTLSHYLKQKNLM